MNKSEILIELDKKEKLLYKKYNARRITFSYFILCLFNIFSVRSMYL